MDRTPTLLALVALASLPASAFAQNRASHEVPATSSAAMHRVGTSTALTRRGVHSDPSHTLADGLVVVDEQQIDVDGDGDLDSLVMLDVREDREPKPEARRGVAVIYRERNGFRAETIASVPRLPLEAGYNWGPVESLRAGSVPLLHLMYSQAVPGETTRVQDTVLLFDRGGFREVYARSVITASGEGSNAVARALTVQALDVDGDGTSELLERVAESTHCPESGCVSDDGMFAPTVARRTLRWEPTAFRFVEAPALSSHQTAAQNELEHSTAAWRAGDLAARDAGIVRAYALDPLDANVRLAYARHALRAHDFEAGLTALEFAWPEGLGREAQALRAEAAAASHDRSCPREIGRLRESTAPDAVARADALSASFPDCH